MLVGENIYFRSYRCLAFSRSLTTKMNNRGQSKGAYYRAKDRLRSKLDNRNEASQSDGTVQQERPPPGLKGKEIGLWYRDRNSDKRKQMKINPDAKLVSYIQLQNSCYYSIPDLFPDFYFVAFGTDDITYKRPNK